jgi:hypothetical protein
VNLYEFVGNNGIGKFDMLGLATTITGNGYISTTAGCEVCGPDITMWLYKTMYRNGISLEATKLASYNAIIGAPLAKASAYLLWISLVKTEETWDLKYTYDMSRMKSGFCPTEKCKGYLTLCGECLRFDLAGNIHYGYVGIKSGFTELELINGASIAQFVSTRGGHFDPPEDTESIKVGIELAKAGGIGFCAILKRSLPLLKSAKGVYRADCAPCSSQWK